jgi:hypothetical protein
MDNALKLRVMFDMIDGFTKPLKNMLAGNKGLASSLKDTRRELAEMGKTQKNVAAFREMHAGLSETSTKLTAARKRVKEMADSLRAFGPPSQQMTADLTKARQAASQLKAEQKKQTAGLQEMRERLAGAGIDTRNLSQHERELRTNIAATTATMNAQMGKLDAISERERKLATARKNMQAMQGVAAGMAVGGYAARSTAWRSFGSAAMFAGRAMLTTPIGLVIAAIVAAVAVAALVIRKYWEPIKAFFAGMFDGLLSGLAPFGAALGAAFSALGAIGAELKPIFFAPVMDLFAGIWNWFSQLLEPVRSTGAELSAAAGYGRTFGEVLGGALRFVFMPLELLAKGIALLPRVIESFLADATTAFSGGLAGIGALILNWSPLGVFYQAFAGVLSWFGFELPAKFSEFGANILSGLVNGIASGLGAVKDAITGVADSTVGWFKEKLGIHSPSRVFGELGGFIGQGAAIGMEGEQGRVAKAAIGLATIAATSFGMPALASGAAIAQAAAVPIVRATVPIDTRPPLGAAPAGASAAGNSAPAAFGPITINIYPPAGMDTAEVGRMVRAELERAQRTQQARTASRLSD